MAPSISVSGAATASEGSAYTLTLGTVADPGTDAVTQFVVHWGDGTTTTYPTAGVTAHTYADDGTYAVSVDLTDEDGTYSNTANAQSVSVSDVPPTLTAFTVPAAGSVGSPVSASAAATDPAGANDPLAFTWTATLNGTVVATGTGTAFAFTPAAPGTYAVSVNVDDGDGGTASASRRRARTRSAPSSAGRRPSPAGRDPTPARSAPAAPAAPAGGWSPRLWCSVNAGRVRVVEPDGTARDLTPFPGFLGDVTVALADLTGDGTPDVVAGAGQGGGPHVKVFDGRTLGELASFFAYAPGFTGGVFVAATPDGRIVTGAGAGGGPHVKVIPFARAADVYPDGPRRSEIRDDALLASFFPYALDFGGGVRVAAGDVTADGYDDVITGAGPGGGPHVKAFDGRTAKEVRSFYAFADDFAEGVYVAVSANGMIAAGAGTWGAPEVRLFDPAGHPLGKAPAFAPDFVGGVRVAFADVDADGTDDLLVSPGLGAAQPVRVLRANDFGELTTLAPFAPLDPLGVFVG